MSTSMELNGSEIFHGGNKTDRWMEGLPPPPNHLQSTIQEFSIPRQPAKPWDRSSDGEDSDEGVDNSEKLCEDSDSTLETESECPTEIWIPSPSEKKAGASAVVARRLVGEVIPSVSNQALPGNCGLRQTIATGGQPHLVSVTGKYAGPTAVASEDVANIDSGISNETGGENGTTTSQDGTVRLRRLPSAAADSTSGSSHYSSSYSCGSRGDAHPPVSLGEGIRERELLAYMKEAKMLRIASILSGSYGLALIVLGIVLPLAEETRRAAHNQPSLQQYAAGGTVFKAYYTYVYGISLIFLAYAYAYVLWDRSKRRQHKQHRHKGPGHAHTANPKTSRNSAPCDSKLQATVGSLFLRIGAVVFCIGCMVDNGMSFGVKVSSGCSDLLNSLQPLAQLVFAFAQIYFVFVNSQMCLRRYMLVAKFGIMHLVAANVAAWTHRVIEEIYRGSPTSFARVLNSEESSTVTEARSEAGAEAGAEAGLCASNQPLVDIVESAKPYLAPLAIQYYLVVAAILCTLWTSIGCASYSADGASSSQCAECVERGVRQRLEGTRTIDCRRTGLGLSAGVVVLSGALASLIAHAVLRRVKPQHETAALLVCCYQMASYCLMLIVAVATLLRVRLLDYNACRSTGLEDGLLGAGATAVLARDLWGAAAAACSPGSVGPLTVVSLAACAVDIVQSVVQSAAIALALKLHCSNGDEADSKPGRQCVAFLLVANIALWAACTFSGSASTLPELFVGGAPSTGMHLLRLVVEPLALSYRFVSAACFTDIWHDLYRSPRVDAV